MKKGGFFRNVLDTIRSNQANEKSQSGSGHHSKATEYGNQLKSSHFSLAQVARHGFPEHPTALAFDPVQKLACIGTKSGALRIFGRPGVDVWAQHKPEFAVTHIKFVVNQGAIITVTADESIHLWSICGPNLKLQFSSNTNASNSTISPSQSSCSKANSPTVGSGQQTTGSLLTTTSAAHPISTSTSASTATTSGLGSSSLLADHHHHGHHLSSASGRGTQIGDPNFLTDLHGTSNSSLIDQPPKCPEILHTLKFQREHITCLHLTLADKWLYIGTEKGNVHVANVETFELSGYSIAWNKAIELSRKSHPGSIIHLSECPQDTNKILIGYESGCIVLWDLKTKSAEGRYYNGENLLSLAWHHEGKQFIAAHGDGSLVTWQKTSARPVNIVQPHAKSPSQTASTTLHQQQQQQQQQQYANNNNSNSLTTSSADSVQSLTSSFARVLNTNNECYKPINKVDWKTTKHQEQLLILSGGLPYEGSLSPSPQAASLSSSSQQLDHHQSGSSSLAPMTPNSVFGSPSSTSPFASPRLTTPVPANESTASNQQAPSQSPINPSKSPIPNLVAATNTINNRPASACSRQSTTTMVRDRLACRSTSLTVMLGKSITVLEMDDSIIDFITICDNSPYENDTVEPLALIVLLSSDFIVIDLSSPSYPSFESPYPSSQLRDSPVTCIQYLPDCNQDLIPFLYSSSQNVVSCGPKRGFSDKEWPVNGGEWGQSMQSYPELVITGHADGSLKFWDMSGVNFDLISKIKTSRLFEKPLELPDSLIIPYASALNHRQSMSKPAQANLGRQFASPSNLSGEQPSGEQLLPNGPNNTVVDGDYFAIEKIEYYPATKHLVVAGAMSQVIQFRLTKKDAAQSLSDLTTITVESLPPPLTPSDTTNQSYPIQQQQQQQQHCLLKTKTTSTAGAGAGAAGPGLASVSRRSGAETSGRFGGFQAELICLTSMIVSPVQERLAANNLPPTTTTRQSRKISYCCHAPPKVTAIALNENHNILAYSHKYGLVLMDITQKCLILNASLLDLYGTTPTPSNVNPNFITSNSNANNNNRDISIQSYETSAILQQHHHYSSGQENTSSLVSGGGKSGATNNSSSPFTMCQQQQYANVDNGAKARDSFGNGSIDATEKAPSLSKSPAAHNSAMGCSSELIQGQAAATETSEARQAKTMIDETSTAECKHQQQQDQTSKQPDRQQSHQAKSSGAPIEPETSPKSSAIDTTTGNDDFKDGTRMKVVGESMGPAMSADGSQTTNLMNDELGRRAAEGKNVSNVVDQSTTTAADQDGDFVFVDKPACQLEGPGSSAADQAAGASGSVAACDASMSKPSSSGVANAAKKTPRSAVAAAVVVSDDQIPLRADVSKTSADLLTSTTIPLPGQACVGQDSSGAVDESPAPHPESHLAPELIMDNKKWVSTSGNGDDHDDEQGDCDDSSSGAAAKPSPLDHSLYNINNNDNDVVDVVIDPDKRPVAPPRSRSKRAQQQQLADGQDGARESGAPIGGGESGLAAGDNALVGAQAKSRAQIDVVEIGLDAADSIEIQNNNNNNKDQITHAESKLAKVNDENLKPASGKQLEIRATTSSSTTREVETPAVVAQRVGRLEASQSSPEPLESEQKSSTGLLMGLFSKLKAFAKVAPNQAGEPERTKPPIIQSRFAANSAFQRQLSSQALMQGKTGELTKNSTAGSSTPSGADHRQQPQRLFQRQATTSQLGYTSGAASRPAGQSADYPRYNNNDNTSAGVLTKRNASKVSSNTNLSTIGNSPQEAQQQPPSSYMNSNDGAKQASGSKITKQKRMISRMLSISAIHTTFSDTIGSNKSSANNNNNSQDDHYNNNHHQQQQPSYYHSQQKEPISNNSGATFAAIGDHHHHHQQQHHHHQDQVAGGGVAQAAASQPLTATTLISKTGSSGNNTTTTSSTSTGNASTQNNQIMHSDKFDSSFTRSRSSSSSSYVHPAEAALANSGMAQTGLESIQCLCFLDATQPSSAAAASSQTSATSTTATGSSGATAGTTSSAADQYAHHGHPLEANKSLGSLDQNNSSPRFLALWLGTSRGSVMMVNLTMPDSEDNRVLQLQSVVAEPIPQSCIKMVGSILNLGAFYLEPTRSWSPCSTTNSPHLNSQASAGSMESEPPSSTSGSSGSSSGATIRAAAAAAPGDQHEARQAQFMVIVSEKQARVYQVPTTLAAAAFRNPTGPTNPSGSHGGGHGGHSTSTAQANQDNSSYTHQMSKFLSNKTNCLAKCQLSDTSYARKSAIMSWRQPVEGECCLVNYLATGNLIVHSLPHLRPLLDTDLVAETNHLIASSMLFGRNGHCLYQASPMEICKFTISAQYKLMLNDMFGTLFTPREMPEMARPNFFKSLFSVASSAASRQSERDELFGESGAGKPSRTVAKHIAGMDKLKMSQGGLASDLLQAREGLDERGEKLSTLEDRTLAMMNTAQTYSQAAGELAQKYKDKKWYQF